MPKYGHSLDQVFALERKEAALLCLLLLRGPQTVGELRGRSERLYEFETLDAVTETLKILEDMHLAKNLPRVPGHKESRYAHLLGGEPETHMQPTAPKTEAARLEIQAEDERIATIEREVELLKEELETLRKDFLAFKRQFE